MSCKIVERVTCRSRRVLVTPVQCPVTRRSPSED